MDNSTRGTCGARSTFRTLRLWIPAYVILLCGAAPAGAEISNAQGGTYADPATGFSVVLPEGWKQDSARQEERDRFFQNVKNMGLLVRGIPMSGDMGCSAFFVSPDAKAYVEVHWGDSPVPVEPKLAFAFTPHEVYHPGYARIGDPVIDPTTNNVTQVYRFKDGMAKELYSARVNPNRVRVITCAAASESAFKQYEATCDQVLKSVNVAAVSKVPEGPQEDPQEDPQPFRITAGPYLQNVQKTGITIMWETSQAAASRVRYGLERLTPMGDTFMVEVNYTENVAADTPTKIHAVNVSGLKQRTIYHYQVISRLPSGEEVASEDAVFRSAPDASTPFSFAVYGDSRHPAMSNGAWDTHAKVAQAIHAARPDLVLHTGDLTLDGRQHKRWLTEFFEPAKQLFSDTPLYAAIGNHEANAHWFYDLFSFPPPENYYSFDYGNTHFIALDSYANVKGVAEYGVIGRDSAEYRWLVSDLRSSKAKWKVVLLHHPIYDSSFQSDPQSIQLRQTLSPVFEQYGVDIVFNGHDHLYERSYPMRGGKVDLKRGIPYVTTGGGGAEPHQFLQRKKAEFIVTGQVVPHYCVVNVADGLLEMKVLDLDGRLIDSLAITK
ncbi:MAG: metallophosphoesterase [Deltaproteobacteria bacterium]|nr:metallophosphoesterase [Deltaproteobacteria bacterium]